MDFPPVFQPRNDIVAVGGRGRGRGGGRGSRGGRGRGGRGGQGRGKHSGRVLLDEVDGGVVVPNANVVVSNVNVVPNENVVPNVVCGRGDDGNAIGRGRGHGRGRGRGGRDGQG